MPSPAAPTSSNQARYEPPKPQQEARLFRVAVGERRADDGEASLVPRVELDDRVLRGLVEVRGPGDRRIVTRLLHEIPALVVIGAAIPVLEQDGADRVARSYGVQEADHPTRRGLERLACVDRVRIGGRRAHSPIIADIGPLLDGSAARC
jgi:hypothetical protein